MCNDCSGSGESNCGCYGNCNLCGNDVNRGSDGCPCYECKKWYCSECKYNVDTNCEEYSNNNE